MCPDAGTVRPTLQRLDWFILLSVGLLSSAWCLTAARELGATFDEPLYVVQGLGYWRTGDRHELLLAGVMPLSSYLQTLPLWIVERVTGHAWYWEHHAGEMLVIARSTNLIFWWLLLFYAMRLGHALGGPWAGRWSLLLLGLEPNFLAHASLATTDLSLAACLAVFVYHFRESRSAPDWRRRVAMPGALFALPILAKASAIVFGPLAMILVELERLIRSGALPRFWNGRARDSLARWWRLFAGLRRDGFAIFAIGFVIAMLFCWTGGYGSFQTTLARMPADNPIRPLFAWFANLPIFPNGLYAIWYQITHNVSGQPTYLIGYDDPKTLWFFLPMMMSIKLPLAILIVVAASLAIPGSRWRWALWLVGMFVVISLIMRVNIGIRLLLPVEAFVVIASIARICRALPSLSENGRRLGVSGLVVAVSWLVWTDMRIWPDAIRHTNELWGNTDRGYLYVSDSNFDWGQGLPELAQWQRQQAKPLKVWYFGQDERYPELVRFDPARQNPADRVPPGGYFAVSTTFLYGGYSSAVRPFVMQLRSQAPVARTRTFLIFDRTSP
jgi:hypothetical protein